MWLACMLAGLFDQEGEAFTKTSCYHYFHSYCLGRYITYSENELREREKELEEDKSREKLDEVSQKDILSQARFPSGGGGGGGGAPPGPPPQKNTSPNTSKQTTQTTH